MKQVYTREDGTTYIFDEDNFLQLCGKIEETLDSLRAIPEILSRYEDTEEGSKSPDYIRGVLREGFSFIRKEREGRIRENLKGVPFGKSALNRLIEETLDEIPDTLQTELSRVFDKTKRSDPLNLLKVQDISITTDKETGEIVLSLPEGLFDELRKKQEIGINPNFLKDCETFREAVRLLWSLQDKGYNFQDGVIFNPVTNQAIPTPSYVSRLMGRTTEEEREEALSIISLFEGLQRVFSVKGGNKI